VRYSVAPEVFARHPDYVRAVVVGRGLVNPADVPQEALVLLRTAESLVRVRRDLDQPALHDRIANWRAAYSAFGARPSKYLSAVEAGVRRARQGEPLPAPSTLVALTAAITLQHLVPAGAHDAGQVQSHLWLGPARGDERFTPLSDPALVEHPEPGEIVYLDGERVLTRRWTWRQGAHTAVSPATSFVAINVDALPPVTRAEVEAIAVQLADLVRRFCGGRVGVDLLSATRPQIEF
jgi:DNA/RNA-binding domain of Phe-tRNA-synthetase-like protein